MSIKKFLGGSALGVYYLFKEGIVEPSVDPLGPDNMIQFMIGPYHRQPAPNARSTIVTKSAYNFICITTSGGQAAAELKYAGWDGIQVVGKASSPVYLAVTDDNVEIRDASHVWGMGAEEAEIILKSEVVGRAGKPRRHAARCRPDP
jgi:aldehyde:ferredoxin oxidoreductase